MKSTLKKVFLFLPNHALFVAGILFNYSCSNSEFSEYEQTETGLYYKFHVDGADTAHPKYGDYIRFKMIIKMKDSIVQNSDMFSPDGIRDVLRQPAFKGGIEEGLQMMSIGDSATFLVSADSINKYYPARDSSKNLVAKSYLQFNLKLINIQKEQEVRWEDEQNKKKFMEERKTKGPLELQQYITDNHIEQQPTVSGLYIIEKEKGNGIFPQDNDTVIVHYTGTLLNGTEFDSSVKRGEPFKFVVNDKGSMSVITGWNEAVKLMKKGTIATILLPYSLAYDSVGVQNQQTGQYFIEPYTPLKFDIQLIDIKTKK